MPGPLPDSMKAAIMDAVRAAFTEDRTDEFISRITARLPWWTKALPVGRVLDELLPDVIIDFLDEVL